MKREGEGAGGWEKLQVISGLLSPQYVTLNNPFHNLLSLKAWKRESRRHFWLSLYLLRRCLFYILDQLSQFQGPSDTCLCLHIPTANKAKLEHQMHKNAPLNHIQRRIVRAHLSNELSKWSWKFNSDSLHLCPLSCQILAADTDWGAAVSV